MDKEGWQEQAYAALRKWAMADYTSMMSTAGSAPWTVEHMRATSYGVSKLDEPADLRWWGPVVQRALREKIIRRKGFAPAKSSHGALKASYVGTRFA